MYTRDGVIAVVFPYPVHLRQPKRNVNQEKGLRVQAFGLCRLIEARYVVSLVSIISLSNEALSTLFSGKTSSLCSSFNMHYINYNRNEVLLLRSSNSTHDFVFLLLNFILKSTPVATTML